VEKQGIIVEEGFQTGQFRTKYGSIKKIDFLIKRFIGFLFQTWFRDRNRDQSGYYNKKMNNMCK